jgi:hypothetical protein
MTRKNNRFQRVRLKSLARFSFDKQKARRYSFGVMFFKKGEGNDKGTRFQSDGVDGHSKNH